MTSTPLFLHNHPGSCYCQKIRIALREKHLPFTASTPPNFALGTPTPALTAITPRNQVPALEDGTLKIFDSTIILAYLEDAYPLPALLPASPRARAEARIVEEICDTQYEPLTWAYLELEWLERARERPEVGAELHRQIRVQAGVVHEWFEARLEGKEFFGGEAFGYADVCVAPFVHQAVEYGFGPVKGSRLLEWYGRVKGRKSVRETFAEKAEGARMTSLVGMKETGDGVTEKNMSAAGMKEMFLSGQAKREYRDHRLEFLVKSGGIDIVLDGLKRDNIRFSWPDPA